jgi:hypothetical protein
MAWALLAMGLVLVAEGLIWALAPQLVEQLLMALRSLSPEQRRLAGLAALSLGLSLIWAARLLGEVPT